MYPGSAGAVGVVATIVQLEEHRVADVEPSQLLQGGRRHDDLPPVLHLKAILIREHHGEAAILLLEGEGQRPPHGHPEPKEPCLSGHVLLQ